MQIIKNSQKAPEQKGFALLVTLIVVSVLISIGLSVLDLSIKQVRLATNAKDSEISFHAANAGLECALYWRRFTDDTMERGQAITPTCFRTNSLPAIVSGTRITAGVSGGDVFQYKYEFTWGSPQRCSQINTIVGSSSASTDLTISGMTSGASPLVPGYPDGNVKTCEAGTKCTVISVQGFNKPCTSTNGFGTVQREVLLQL